MGVAQEGASSDYDQGSARPSYDNDGENNGNYTMPQGQQQMYEQQAGAFPTYQQTVGLDGLDAGGPDGQDKAIQIGHLQFKIRKQMIRLNITSFLLCTGLSTMLLISILTGAVGAIVITIGMCCGVAWLFLGLIIKNSLMMMAYSMYDTACICCFSVSMVIVFFILTLSRFVHSQPGLIVLYVLLLLLHCCIIPCMCLTAYQTAVLSQALNKAMFSRNVAGPPVVLQMHAGQPGPMVEMGGRQGGPPGGQLYAEYPPQQYNPMQQQQQAPPQGGYQYPTFQVPPDQGAVPYPHATDRHDPPWQ